MPKNNPNTACALFATNMATIVIPHVVMTRWDGKLNTSLQVYFTEGPHITLDADDGKEFLEALEHYYMGREKCH